MPDSNQRIVLLPGMGADGSMYQGAWRDLADCNFPDWPDGGGVFNLKELAGRIINDSKVTSSDIVGGSSFGGMVALEIAGLLGNPTVVLLGSAMNRSEIRPLLVKLAGLADFTPFAVFQSFAASTSGRLAEMFAGASPEFLREACKALKDWTGVADFEGKVIRIHGGRDHIIRPPAEAFIIPDAGHLVAMTHARECVDWMKGRLQGESA